jgi:predicted unusual protein kinase regulating ubiquinone biosynthesis (AarF/ABC1/UbiB family)
MNILLLFIKIIQYKLSIDKKNSIKDIKNILQESGPIWQKFSQVLSYQEELIGPELAIELQKMLFKCPTHVHEYSKKIVKESFGNKYDIDKINEDSLIGSGTIAQVYKLDENVIKILHPLIKQEVGITRTDYLNIRNSFLFPSNLKVFCDWFFDGLVQQINMEKEYNSCIIMKNLMSNNNNNDNLTNLFIFPEMKDFSNDCIVMSYEPSEPILLEIRDSFDKLILFKTCLAMVFFQIACVQHGFIHGDMHYGNFGIQNRHSYENMKIVIYDFGLIVDVRHIPKNKLNSVAYSMSYNNIDTITKLMMENIEYSQRHINIVSKTFKYNKFEDDFVKLVLYISFNNIDMNKDILTILLSCEKCKIFHNIISKIILLPEMKDKLRITDTHSKETLQIIFKDYLNYNEFVLLSKLIMA